MYSKIYRAFKKRAKSLSSSWKEQVKSKDVRKLQLNSHTNQDHARKLLLLSCLSEPLLVASQLKERICKTQSTEKQL